MRILAIDPGSDYSGFAICECGDCRILEIIKAGKADNFEILTIIREEYGKHRNKTRMAIELIESYGMPVGKSVFDTCIWTGRFIQEAIRASLLGVEYTYITRREEKLSLCGSMKAKDANIRQALIDKYALHDFKNGKGTKQNPDFFYGFKADMWSAAAVADTYLSIKHDTVRGCEQNQKEVGPMG